MVISGGAANNYARLFGSVNRETISADKQLTVRSAPIQSLDVNGFNLNVIAPPEVPLMTFMIHRRGAGGGQLTFQNSDGVDVINVPANEGRIFVFDGTDWIFTGA